MLFNCVYSCSLCTKHASLSFVKFSEVVGSNEVKVDAADKHLHIAVNLCKLKLLIFVYCSMAIICCFLRKCSQFVRLDLFVSRLFVCVAVGCIYIIFPKDLERSRLTTIFIKIAAHLKLTLKGRFRSFNDHHQLKVGFRHRPHIYPEICENANFFLRIRLASTRREISIKSNRLAKGNKRVYNIDMLIKTRELN